MRNSLRFFELPFHDDSSFPSLFSVFFFQSFAMLVTQQWSILVRSISCSVHTPSPALAVQCFVGHPPERTSDRGQPKRGLCTGVMWKPLTRDNQKHKVSIYPMNFIHFSLQVILDASKAQLLIKFHRFLCNCVGKE